MHVKCECSLPTTEIDYESKKFTGMDIISSFYDVLKYSNIYILKCYNILFSLIGIKNNYGFIIMIIFIISLIAFTILFLLTGIKTIREQMTDMAYKELKEINNDFQNGENIININNLQKEITISKKKKKKKKIKISKNNKTLKFKRKSVPNNLNINIANPKCKSKKNKQSLFKDSSTIQQVDNNIKVSKRYSLDLYRKESIVSSEKMKGDLIYNTCNDKNKEKSILSSEKMKEDLIDNTCNDKNKENQEIIKNYSDFELDDLEYLEAIEHDKRSFIDCYFNIVKREHLIIFTFFYCKDFNLLSIKLSLFVFAICLDMTTNILFFNDESMHKIYLDYGEYNFVSQIPQIVYSTIISECLDIFLKYLSLSEKEVYEVKKFKNMNEVGDGIKQLIKCLKIKFIFFFFICFIFMIFFWYFVSIFCAIYENTQIILFEDSSMSLLISLLYPFVLYIFPAGLRIFSLRSIKKNKQILYKISNYIPIF